MTDKQINRESNDVPDAKATVAIILSIKAQCHAHLTDIENTLFGNAAPLGNTPDVTTSDLEVVEVVQTKLVKLAKLTEMSIEQVERLIERLESMPLESTSHPDIESLQDVLRSINYENARLDLIEQQVRRMEVMKRSAKVQSAEVSLQSENQLDIPQPPLNAKFLLYWFLEKKDREVGLGDAVEKYARHVEELGKWRANLLFYQDIALSAWPFVKRLVAKAGGLLLLGEWLRKLIS